MAAKLKAFICPSILNADLSDLANECQRLIDFGADYLHLDVMDGHFVSNLTFGHPLIECLRKKLGADAKLDVHMMVNDPKKWLEQMHKASINQYTFHLEADKLTEKRDEQNEAAVNELIDLVKAKGIRCGLSIKPTTAVEKLMKFGAKIDAALIMTVEPGQGGQKFMGDQMQKVRKLREAYPKLDIQVDGGVGLDNIGTCAKAGANMIVSGTGIVRSDDPRETMQKMREVVENALGEMSDV